MKASKDGLTLKDIAASLKYGKISSRKEYPIWLGLVVLGVAGIMALAAIPSVRSSDGFLGWIFLCLLPVAFGTLVLGMDAAIRRKLNKCLQSGVRLIGEGCVSESKKKPENVKIVVKFRDGKKKVSKASESYDKAFYEYCGREIGIVYSKEFDDVLILKDRSSDN